MSQSHARFAFPWGSPSSKKEAPFSGLASTCIIYNVVKYMLPVDGVREGCGSHFSGVGDPLKTGPATNSVVMCGYPCPGPRNGHALRSQID